MVILYFVAPSYYNLKWYDVKGKYLGLPRLFNNLVDEVRRILVHWGNNFQHTEGCILLGKTWIKRTRIKLRDKKTKEDILDKHGNPTYVYDRHVGASEKEVKNVSNIMKKNRKRGEEYENYELHIFEDLLKDEKSNEDQN